MGNKTPGDWTELDGFLKKYTISLFKPLDKPIFSIICSTGSLCKQLNSLLAHMHKKSTRKRMLEKIHLTDNKAIRTTSVKYKFVIQIAPFP